MTMVVSLNELVEKLANASRDEREQIIEILASIGTPAVEPLIEALNRNHGRQSWLAAKTLSRIEDHRVVPALIDALPNLSNVLQGMIVEILGNLGDEKAVSSLIEILNRGDVVLQTAVVQALRKIGDRRAVEPFLNVLSRTGSTSLRYTIIEALGELGDYRLIDTIRQYENDENHHVRRRAKRAIEELYSRT